MKKEEFLASGLGLGKLPWSPGMWGLLPPVVVYQVLGYLEPAANPFVMACFLIVGAWLCVTYAPAVIQATGLKDPQIVVVDALAGQALTMLMIALLAPANICNSMALGFILFWLLDLIKPWPCKRLREKMPIGIGILADDLMAGLYAGILAYILIYLFPIFGEAGLL
jgi:phosphatidylglycerophosphatase A